MRTVAGRRVGEVDDGPVVVAVPLRAASGGQFLPGPLRGLPDQRVGAERARTGGHFGRAGHREDIAQAAISRADLSVGLPLQTSSPVTQSMQCPASRNRSIIVRANSGLVAKRCPRRARPPGIGPGPRSTSAGRTTPGPPPRARGRPHRRGRRRPGSSRSVRRFRCAGAEPPTVRVPFFTSPVSSTTSTAASSWRCSTTYSRTSSRTASASQASRHSRCCMPWGAFSPAHSAIVQQFLRGRSDSSPSTNRPARSRGSTG